MGTSALFLTEVSDIVNCKDQAGQPTGIPDLSAYGTVHPLQDPRLTHATTASEAAAQSRLTLLRPGTLPKDASARRKFRVDRLYVQKLTFALDVRLIVLSFWISFRGKWETRGSKT